MRLKKRNFVALSIFSILLLAAGAFLTPGAAQDVVVTWQVEEDTELVYRITHILYNETDHFEVGDGEGEGPRGEWVENDLMEFQVRYLPSFEGGDNEVTLDMSVSHMEGGMDYRYNISGRGWPEKVDGPIFLWPVSTVPDPEDPNAAANWTEIVDEWNSTTGMNATDTGSHFELTGTNATLNITLFDGIWEKDTGIMTYYWLNTTWGPNSEGANEYPIELEVNFMYIRDPGQWNMGWGVNEGDSAAWSVDTLNFSGLDYVPFGNESGEEQYLYEGDILFFSFMELWDPMGEGGDPHWNGSIMTKTFSDSYEMYLFGDDDDHEEEPPPTILQEEDEGGDEPMFFMPLFLTGNVLLYGNLSDMMAAMGATIINNDTHFGLHFEFVDPDTGGYHNESALWDKTTGLQMEYWFDGFIYNETSTEHNPLFFEISFLYYIDNSTIDYGWGVSEGYHQRYLVTEAWNGTNDYIDFGPNEMNETFRFYDDDILAVNFGGLMTEEEDGPEMWHLWLQTSRNYETEMKYMILPPGLELSKHAEGPPAFYFAFPTGDTTWWTIAEDLFDSVGYTVTNNATTFGIEMEGPIIGDDELENVYLNVMWSKAAGFMEYYYVEANFTDGTEIGWEMVRGIGFEMSNLSWNWGVSLGHTMMYEINSILVDGSPGSLPWGGEGSTAEISTGDEMTFWITVMGSLDTSTENSGPWFNTSGIADGVVETDMYWSLEEPGFEFPEVWREDALRAEGPPFMVFVIPVGDMAYWSLLEDLYEESGYTVTNGATEFTVVNPIGEITWSKTNGVMTHYEGTWEMDGQTFFIEVTLTGEDTTPPDTESTSEDESGAVPGFESFVVVPILAAMALTLRRRRE